MGLGRVLREEGLHGLYKGLSPSLLGTIHVAVQFPLYERFKLFFAERRNVRTDQLGMSELLVASSSSKIIASIAAYPHEVLRTRLQDQRSDSSSRHYRGLWATTRTIIREETWRGLYSGMGANLPRVTLSCAVTFTSYELLLRKTRQYL